MIPAQLELMSNPTVDMYPTRIRQALYTILVTHLRSAETIALNEYNQDAYAIWADNQRLVVAIADGVGQSFRGDIAAMSVVQTISHILCRAQISYQLEKHLTHQLIDLSSQVQALLHTIDVSYYPVMLRDSLELRRQLGSESVFAACSIDWTSNLIYLCWLGDCRIRLVDQNNQPILLDPNLFRTAERWSSQRMLVGDLHSIYIPLNSINRVIIYSDGLYMLDDEDMNDPEINRLVHDTIGKSQKQPESDDITLVMIDFTRTT